VSRFEVTALENIHIRTKSMNKLDLTPNGSDALINLTGSLFPSSIPLA